MAAIVLLFVLLLAAPAGAATVTMGSGTECPPKSGCFPYTSIDFTAAPGETNDLRVTTSGEERRFQDLGAVLHPAGGCESVDAHTVVCRAPSLLFFAIELGDGDDRASAKGAKVEGGEGNDVIDAATGIGGPGNDQITGSGFNEGGPGDDRITGGGDAGPGDDVVQVLTRVNWIIRLGTGRDVFVGSPGSDFVVDDDGSASRDRIDGRGGRDWLDYGEAAGPVDVDLMAPGRGSDEVTAVERVRGSRLGDVLRGSEGPDELEAGGGNDVLLGRGGDDRLEGSDGRDRIDGGAGDDEASGGLQPDRIDLGAGADRVHTAGDFYRDVVRCGPGADRGGFDRGDVRRGCERQKLHELERIIRHVEPLGGGHYRIVYDGCGGWTECRGHSRLRARVAGRAVRLPTVRFRRHPFVEEDIRSARFRLPASARRELRVTGRLRIEATSFLDPGPAGGALPVGDLVWLRHRARNPASDR